ncbi:somatostatin receptor type 4-like [Paramacrobiotus metropolitanus]|uniref:somatostatin receptor type 4-like n=1 Tax=Paramacrobiotus metropolitanus TaxID=2943436 RepID=UPI00244594ED|nr:somatostatin receptor type 4-like [Paramacrobiotus metropolitanus]
MPIDSYNATLLFSNSTITSVLSRPFVLSWFTASFIINLLGSSSSFLLIFALCTRSRFHSTTNLLVIHLLLIEAINMAAPTMLAIFAVLLHETHRPFPVHCSIVAFTQILFTVLSNWLSALLAINRLTAKLWPYRHKTWTTKSTVTMAVVGTWVLSLATTIPLLFGVGGRLDRFYPLGYCGVKPTPGVMFAVYTNISFTCPLSVQAVCYALIVGSLQRSMVACPTVVAAQRRRRQRAISFVLLVVFVWYLVCYLPIPIITTYFYGQWQTDHRLFVCFKTLMTCGSAGTPIILLSLSSEYRLAVKERWRQVNFPCSFLCSAVWESRNLHKSRVSVISVPAVLVTDCSAGDPMNVDHCNI